MEPGTVRQPHSLLLENRRKSTISGVLDVQSFNEQEILLLTEEGKLQIKGEQLHIKGLDLEKGKAGIEGKINSLIYLRNRFCNVERGKQIEQVKKKQEKH